MGLDFGQGLSGFGKAVRLRSQILLARLKPALGGKYVWLQNTDEILKTP